MTDYKQRLNVALEEIRCIRNNVSYEEFGNMVAALTGDNANVRFPLLQAAQIAHESAYGYIHKSGD